jgi:molybdopterin converting factor small subunit
MVQITFASSLAAYLPHGDDPASGGHRTITVDGATWPDAVREIRKKYERLGEHLFDASGTLRSGFLVAVNDQLRPRPHLLPALDPGDSIFIFTQIAGG